MGLFPAGIRAGQRRDAEPAAPPRVRPAAVSSIPFLMAVAWRTEHDGPGSPSARPARRQPRYRLLPSLPRSIRGEARPTRDASARDLCAVHGNRRFPAVPISS